MSCRPRSRLSHKKKHTFKGPTKPKEEYFDFGLGKYLEYTNLYIEDRRLLLLRGRKMNTTLRRVIDKAYLDHCSFEQFMQRLADLMILKEGKETWALTYEHIDRNNVRRSIARYIEQKGYEFNSIE